MSKNNGGPAFPGTKDKWGDPLPGLTIRDWFAAKAMQGLVGAVQSIPRAAIAEHAYLMADAMLAEREKGDE